MRSDKYTYYIHLHPKNTRLGTVNGYVSFYFRPVLYNIISSSELTFPYAYYARPTVNRGDQCIARVKHS